MTSERVMLILIALILSLLSGCAGWRGDDDGFMSTGIYPRQQLWAVAPMGNESGSLYVEGARVADHLVNQLENQPGIDVLPVNRVYAVMQELKMPTVASRADALTLRNALNVDALVVGTVTTYNPYDPPKLGLAIELYVDDRLPWFGSLRDVRGLSHAGTDTYSRPKTAPDQQLQPITVASGFFDASEPKTRRALKDYTYRRGVEPKDKHAWRIYRINMDLYTEFVTHVVSSRLMRAERQRLAPQVMATQQPAY